MLVKPWRSTFTTAAAASLLTAAAAGSPIEALRACASVAPKAAHGMEKLTAACPELPDVLRASGMDKLLNAGWRNTLNPQALLDLSELAARYDASPSRAAPGIASLHDIVEAVNGK